jgi:hypothetical protein
MSRLQLVKRIEMALAFLKTGRPDHARHFLEAIIDDLTHREREPVEELPLRPRATNIR